MQHFNHARRGRALAAISGKVPSVSGVWVQYLLSSILILLKGKTKTKSQGSKPEFSSLFVSLEIRPDYAIYVSLRGHNWVNSAHGP